MVMRLLLALTLLLAGLPAAAETAWPPETRLRLLLDPAPPPVMGEMVLATLRGEYIGNVALEHLSVPALDGFGWLQLTPPVWREERIANRLTKVFEQRLALFPRRAGALTIGPITHALTFAGEGPRRLAVEAVTEPVAIEVAYPPDLGGTTWMPARSVSVTDDWDPEPDTLAPEQWTRRTVTIEVAGLPPESLPPAPSMAAGGLFSFVDPEERSVKLTPDGPISTVVWHYRMQPQSDAPADLDDIPISWFDTGARVGREEVLEGREVAFAASALPRAPGLLARRAIPVGLGGGLLLGLGVLLPRLGPGRGRGVGWARRRFALGRAVAALCIADARRDAPRARAALVSLLRASGVDPAASGALARIDRHLFAPGGGDWPSLSRAAVAEVRAALRTRPV